MTTRCVGYARISELTDSSTSIQRQRELIEATCKARGWTLLEIIEDVDISASKRRLDRPGMDRLRGLVGRGAVDVVLVWRVDRIARSVRDLSQLVEEWTAQNVALTSCTEAFDTSTPSGRAMLQLLGVFAELEAAVIRERVMASRAALRAGHRFPGGSAPFGYRIVPNPVGAGKALEVVEEEAALVRSVVSGILEGGSITSALKQLNASGVAPRRASHWRLASLKALLVGTSLLGHVSHKREVMRDEFGYPVQVWEPIITEKQAAALRVRFTPRGWNTGGVVGQKRKASRLLSGGLLVCSGCDGPLYAGASEAGRAHYRCSSPERGVACPRKVAINAPAIEEYVTQVWLAMVGDRAQVRYEFDTDEPVDLVKVEEAIAAAGREMALAASQDDAGADELVEALMGRMKALKVRRAALKAAPRELAFVVIPSGLTYREAWDAAASAVDPIGARRSLIGSAVDFVTIMPGVRGSRGPVKPGRAVIRWNDGVE